MNEKETEGKVKKDGVLCGVESGRVGGGRMKCVIRQEHGR